MLEQLESRWLLTSVQAATLRPTSPYLWSAEHPLEHHPLEKQGDPLDPPIENGNAPRAEPPC